MILREIVDKNDSEEELGKAKEKMMNEVRSNNPLYTKVMQ